MLEFSCEVLMESSFILLHAVLCERLYQRGGWHFKIALLLGFTNVLDKGFFPLAVEKLYLWRRDNCNYSHVRIHYVMLCSILLTAWEIYCRHSKSKWWYNNKCTVLTFLFVTIIFTFQSLLSRAFADL